MVTALGCFGGDFNIDNGHLLSFSYKVSDLLSDKFSGLCMQPRKPLTRSSCEGGSDPTATVTHRASKSGVAPALRSCQPPRSATVVRTSIGLTCLVCPPCSGEVTDERKGPVGSGPVRGPSGEVCKDQARD